MEEFGSAKEREEGLVPYLSPLGAWALAVGSAIGWGSFVFTSNLYLSEAGPLGSVLGMLVGMVIMLFISRNYHYLINHYPSEGGVYAFVKKIFGYDRAFLSFWYVGLAYLAMHVGQRHLVAAVCPQFFWRHVPRRLSVYDF